MFTGLIRGLGDILEKKADSRAASLKIKTGLAPGLTLGESVAVNGVCLTAANLGLDWFQADIMPETWHSTNLSYLQPGDQVNLEPALALSDRLGGHLVSGHVDGVGRVIRMDREKNVYMLKISLPGELMRFVTVKGSVAVNGVSLTVQDVAPSEFSLSLIPHTARETNLNRLGPGDPVNIEVDVLARYVVHFLEQRPQKAITASFLEECGFKNT